MGNPKQVGQHVSSAPTRYSVYAARKRNAKPHPLITQLAQERRARRISQETLAEQTGIAQSTVSVLESGIYPPMMLTVDAYARGVDCAIVLAHGRGDKQCQVCGETKPPREFLLDGRALDCRAPYCLACKYEDAVPWSMLRTARGLTNELRTAAYDDRFKVYAGYRDIDKLEPVRAAKRLAEEFGLTERTAQRYEQRYRSSRTAVSA